MFLLSAISDGKLTSLTSFFSLEFFAVFLPVCLIGYAVTPAKCKKYYLLVISYIFYWLISGPLLGYLVGITGAVYGFGLWIDRIQNRQKDALKGLKKEEKKQVKQVYIKKQRRVILFAVIADIGLLLVLKYTAFFLGNVNSLLDIAGIMFRVTIPKFVMPLGISFFTLQALSYVVDVYHGLAKADRNFLRLALFIGFFPQIVEGPICRYSQTADKLWNVRQIEYHNLTMGMQRFLYGMMKKVVIADRMDPFVSSVFSEHKTYQGGVIAIAAVCYTVQLYADFSGSMDAVTGISQILGVEMPENFERPFFSRTISEFWNRWHKTLGAWFRDYIFYPVTTADRMKKLTSSARKKIGNHYGPLLAGSIALFCVWSCNGLWHGSAWNYIFFGMYHFVLILIGSLISPLVKKTNQRFGINSESIAYKTFQMIRTTILVIIGELFFRAEGLRNGFSMFWKMLTDFSFTSFNRELLLKSSLGYKDFAITAVTLVIVFAVSVINEKGISVRDTLAKKNIVIRWAVLYALIMYIVIFGAYGFGYMPVDPLYAQF